MESSCQLPLWRNTLQSSRQQLDLSRSQHKYNHEFLTCFAHIKQFVHRFHTMNILISASNQVVWAIAIRQVVHWQPGRWELQVPQTFLFKQVHKKREIQIFKRNLAEFSWICSCFHRTTAESVFSNLGRDYRRYRYHDFSQRMGFVQNVWSTQRSKWLRNVKNIHLFFPLEMAQQHLFLTVKSQFFWFSCGENSPLCLLSTDFRRSSTASDRIASLDSSSPVEQREQLMYITMEGNMVVLW